MVGQASFVSFFRTWHLFLLVLPLGCNPTFVPPARIALGAMPELDERTHGRVHVQAGAHGSAALQVEGGLADDLTLEMGLSGALSQGGMLMATAGIRRALWRARYVRLALAAGVGVGCGGKVEGRGGCSSRVAYGSYLGLDVGWRALPWLGFYQGTRLQWSVGEGGTPLTFWGFFLGGVQLGTAPAYVSLEGGFVGYESFAQDPRHTMDTSGGLHLSLGAGYRW